MITNIKSVSVKNCVVDEIHMRTKVDTSVDLTSTKGLWQPDTVLMPRFKGNLEAGNIDNAGLKIEKFIITRRKVDEHTTLRIKTVDYTESGSMEFIDYTQPNEKFIYTIIPVGTNDVEGQYNEIEAESMFAGWYVYDKDTNKILKFDKYIGSENMVDTTYNHNKVQIDTMSKYPTIYALPQAYHSFSLSTVVLPEENKKSGDVYKDILNDFIKTNKPFLVKGSNGEVYVCSLSNLRKSTPQNAYKDYDYMTISVDAIEIMDVEKYIEEG